MFHSPLIRFFSTFSLFFSRHIDKSGNTMYTIISDEVEIWRRQVLYFTKQGLAIRCVLHLFLFFCHIFNSKSLGNRISDRICRASGILCKVTNTNATVIHQMSISLLHTSSEVLLGGVDNLICFANNILIGFLVLGAPSVCLRFARKDKDELYLRVFFFQ